MAPRPTGSSGCRRHDGGRRCVDELGDLRPLALHERVRLGVDREESLELACWSVVEALRLRPWRPSPVSAGATRIARSPSRWLWSLDEAVVGRLDGGRQTCATLFRAWKRKLLVGRLLIRQFVEGFAS